MEKDRLLTFIKFFRKGPRGIKYMSHRIRIQLEQYKAGGISLAEQKTVKLPHSLILENRKTLTATGVSNVDSFDEQTVVAYTDLGELVIHGTNLHIDKLNIDSGELILDGEITSMAYEENKATTGGFFSRLFK